MSIYAEVGASLQQICGGIPNGWVVMQGDVFFSQISERT